MQNATVSRYDGSAPRIVTSVPCSVVMVRGTCAPGAGENLPRQIRRRRMRNRVMRVDDVELVRVRHLHQAVGQRQQILRLAKQRISGRLDAMKAHVASDSRRRNGVSLLITCVRCPRSARQRASSDATTPLPPTDA